MLRRTIEIDADLLGEASRLFDRQAAVDVNMHDASLYMAAAAVLGILCTEEIDGPCDMLIAFEEAVFGTEVDHG